MTINIAREFSNLPGPRYQNEGPHSGEQFRESLLQPRFEEARRLAAKLTIELDGAKFGYPSSFLEESFGGLARIFGIDSVLETLIFESSEEPLLTDEIKGYIVDALKTSRQRAGVK